MVDIEREDGDEHVPVLPMTFAPREVLFEPGSLTRGIFIIEEGRAEVFRRSGRRRIPIARIGKGDILGELSTVGERRHLHGVRAVTDLKCLVITPDQFEMLMDQTPPVIRMILKRVVRKVERTTAVAFGRPDED
ncbi:MAG: cyclic nucleotide-binding domain-containing protein [Alphaproteobacteria bacterium]|nr:cyclic nucleotide-binding domain-containing protein [Alphaproteobacteria bacterium]